MCGVIAVLRHPATRPVPAGAELLDAMARAEAHLAGGVGGLVAAAAEVVAVDQLLRGVPGVTLLVDDHGVVDALREATARLEASLSTLEAGLDDRSADVGG